jgi:hypothetical protein
MVACEDTRSGGRSPYDQDAPVSRDTEIHKSQKAAPELARAPSPALPPKKNSDFPYDPYTKILLGLLVVDDKKALKRLWALRKSYLDGKFRMPWPSPDINLNTGPPQNRTRPAETMPYPLLANYGFKNACDLWSKCSHTEEMFWTLFEAMLWAKVREIP